MNSQLTTTINIRVQKKDFSVAEEYALMLENNNGQCGAVAMFVGLVRDFDDLTITTPAQSKINSLVLEHYPKMTESVLEGIAQEACCKWSLLCVNIVHRVGKLNPNNQIVWVGVASSHRADAFSACEMLMDFLKTKAPFWKKTISENKEIWVNAKKNDDEQAKRWE